MAQRRATTPSIYHSLLPAGTPPLLPIPLPAPSTSRRADIPEADTPPWNRLLVAAPTPRVEVEESSAAAVRQPRSTMACRVDHSFVDTVDTRVRDTERRTMTDVEVVNLRDRAAVRAEIELLRRERLDYEQESIETRQDLASYSRALEAWIRVLETQAYCHKWQDRRAHAYTSHQMETEARLSREAWRRSMDASNLARGEVMSLHTIVLAQMSEIKKRCDSTTGPGDHLQGITALHGQVVALQDMSQPTRVSTVLTGTAGPSWSPARQSIQRSLAVQRRSFNGYHFVYSLLSITGLIPASKALENGTKTSHKAMIDQGVTAALAAEIKQEVAMTCHTSETGTEGVVELIQWFERMETVFRISNCPVENQVKFSTCTLLAGALTWWNSHVMTVSHDATYAMTWADLRKKEVLTSIESKE
ncbi:hypothetical protein Tco_0962433 [Tanacetum coccineum]